MDQVNELEQEEIDQIAEWIGEGNPQNWDPEVPYSEYRRFRSESENGEGPCEPQRE